MSDLAYSRYIRKLEKDGIVAIIHQLHPQPIYMKASTWEKLSEKMTKKVVDRDCVLTQELIGRGILIENVATDLSAIEEARLRTIASLSRPTILYLMMAQGCNLKCNYCPIPGLAERHGERLLSEADAIAGIELWLKSIEEHGDDGSEYFIIFYGGEPLLNRDVLESLLRYIGEKRSIRAFPAKLQLMLCTNGLLVDQKIAEVFAKYGMTIAIGFDGSENDRTRMSSSDESTSAGIKKAIRILVENKVRTVVSTTITMKNSDSLEKHAKTLRELGISQFGYNLLKGDALKRELESSNTSNYPEIAANIVLSGLTDKVSESPEVYEYQLSKRLYAVENGLPFSVDCTCYGNQLVIQPDGQVSNCPFLRFDQGYVKNLPKNFKISQSKIVREWRGRLPIFENSATEGTLDGMLNGGGCAWGSLELSGNFLAADLVNARFNNEVMHGIIWHLLPAKEANEIHHGQTDYWCYRRIRNL